MMDFKKFREGIAQPAVCLNLLADTRHIVHHTVIKRNEEAMACSV